MAGLSAIRGSELSDSDSEIPAIDGLLLTRDLMFTSKITSTAASLGLRIETVGNADSIKTRIAAVKPRAIFLDLGWADIAPQSLIEQLGTPRPVVIAFGSHVDTVRLEQARDAGCDDVMPRSKFSATLPDLLRQTFNR